MGERSLQVADGAGAREAERDLWQACPGDDGELMLGHG